LASNLEEDYEEYRLHSMFGGLYPNGDDQLEEGGHKEDGFFTMFGGLYPDEDDQLEDEEPTYDITNYEEDDITDDEEVDKDLSGEVPNFNGEEVDYVNFLGVEDNINPPHDDYGEFYADEENYMFTRETMADPFLSISWHMEGTRQEKSMASLHSKGRCRVFNINVVAMF
jgi:hypothetical protein